MALPPLLKLNTPGEYKRHYESKYQRGVITTFDGIRVYFRQQKFGHAFYANSNKRSGPKDVFSSERAERMDWIKATLEHQDADIYQGWNKDKKCYQADRRVAVVYGNFVVIIEMGVNRKGELRGDFVTCYVADNSIDRIRRSPSWNKEDCLKKLEKK